MNLCDYLVSPIPTTQTTHHLHTMKNYSVRFQPEYQTGRDFSGKNAKRDATAWAKKTEAKIHANLGDKRAKATITAK